jgi:glucose-1-phosphatase
MADLVLGNRTYSNVRNIIFDLGGVIMNIDYEGAIAALKNIGLLHLDEISRQSERIHLFEKFETGAISSQSFRQGIQELCRVKISDTDFDNAWNTMLVDIPLKRYQLLKKLKKDYKIFLLSNTNEIHLDFLFGYVEKNYSLNSLEQLFEKTYYSCRMHLRKPEIEIYEAVLKDSRLNASETLFIDDFQLNIDGSVRAGIQGFCLENNVDIISLFTKYM